MSRSFLPIIIAALSASAGFAQTYTSGSWANALNGVNGVTVMAYSGRGGTVSIPSSLGDFPVKTLGANWAPIFDCSNSTVTSVTTPGSVIDIADLAFQNCLALSSVTIPDSAMRLANNALAFCSGLATN